MIASAHGLDTDLATLRRRVSMSLKGVTLVELVRMADALQLASRPLRAELGQIEQLRTPCVLHWDMNHFVVLVSVRRGVALIHDPAHGERRLTMAELSPHFTGVALELQPMPGFAPRQERQAVRWRELMGPVGGLGRALTQILVLALALEAFVLLSPYFMQWVVDDVLVSANRDLLITLGMGFGLLVLIQTATAAARSWAVLALSASLNLQWLLNVFTHLLRLPIAWFEKRHPGDILSRFGAVQQIQQALTTSFIEALLDGAMVALTLVVMAVYSVPLTTLAVGTVLAYALLRLALLRRLREASAEALIHESRQTSHFLESLRGITAIKLFSAQADRHARFSTLVVETMNADFATRKLELVATVGNRLLFTCRGAAAKHRTRRRELSLCRRRTRRLESRQLAHRGRGVGRHHRPFGLRQDDAAEGDARHPEAQQRRGSHRRRGAFAHGARPCAHARRRGHAGRTAVLRLGRRQHRLLRPRARARAHRAMRSHCRRA